MRYLHFVFLFALSVMGGCFSLSAQEKEVEIQQYDIQLVYDVPKNQLEIQVSLDVTHHTEKASFTVWFSDIAIIKTITCEKQTVDFSHNPARKTLTMQIPPTLAKHPKSKIKLEYLLPLKKEMLQNEMLFLTQKTYWCPILPQSSAKLKLMVTTPEYYQVNVVGIETESKQETGNKWTYHYSSPNTDMSFPLMISTQSDINTQTKQIADKTLSFSFLTAKKETVDKIVENVSKTFEFYSSLLGDYKYTQLSFIEIPGKETKPNIQNNIIMFSKPFVEEFENGNPVFENLTASQWWGNGIKTAPNTDGYCFLQYSMKEFFNLCARFINKDNDEFTTEIDRYKEEFKSKNNTETERNLLSIQKIDSENDQVVIKYKGAVIIYYLTRILGDDIWQTFFKEAYSLYNGKTLTYAAFEELLKAYDTEEGDILKEFQSLMASTGMPELAIPESLSPVEEPESEFEYFQVIEKESEAETPPQPENAPHASKEDRK